MKKTIAILFAVIISITVTAQTFEGKIFYSNSYKSKTPQITDQQLGTMMGLKQEYLYKNGNYKTVANGTMVQWLV